MASLDPLPPPLAMLEPLLPPASSPRSVLQMAATYGHSSGLPALWFPTETPADGAGGGKGSPGRLLIMPTEAPGFHILPPNFRLKDAKRMPRAVHICENNPFTNSPPIILVWMATYVRQRPCPALCVPRAKRGQPRAEARGTYHLGGPPCCPNLCSVGTLGPSQTKPLPDQAAEPTVSKELLLVSRSFRPPTSSHQPLALLPGASKAG